MKHCDRARLCLSHQSPFALHAFANLLLHMLHSSSGMPCSSHHHASCLLACSPAFSTFASFLASRGVQPHANRASTATRGSAKLPVIENDRISHLPGKRSTSTSYRQM